MRATRSSADPEGTKWATSAIWTARLQCPFSSRESEIASSKSRAFAGSIVTVAVEVQVFPRADDGFVEELRLLARLFEHGLVEGVGDIEGPNDAQSVDTRLPMRPQDLDDDPFALAVR